MSKNGLNPSKNGPYPSKHVSLREMFHKENYLSLEKIVPLDNLANHYKMVSKRNSLHAYYYPLVESGTKTGLRAIALCRKDGVLLSKHK